MEWQQIIGFYHTARLGSFTKAAAITLRTQSALSQQVKLLEDEMGCQLFERIGRRTLLLTEAGKRFFTFAQSVLKECDYLREDINGIKGLPKGQVKIAAPFTTLYHLMPEKLKRYRKRFPHVELTILDRNQREVIALTRDGDIDCGLILESVAPKDLSSFRWKKVETVLLTHLTHPLARVKRVTMQQIVQYPLIVPPLNVQYPYRETLEKIFQKTGLDFHIIMESSNIELSSRYVEMGIGISFATVVKNLPTLKKRNIRCIPLRRYFKPDHIALILKKDKILPPYKRAFIQSLTGKSFEGRHAQRFQET